MKNINIGSILATKRRQRGVTQEELADYIGVSKPAVSKWESGQSYPDITLLPVLASYFNMSVDELLGYEPQMTREEIRRLYAKLTSKFTQEPFEVVHTEIKEIIRKYYSCWKLLFAMAQLLLGHSMLAGDPGKIQAVVQESLALSQRIENESGDTVLARQALHMQAACYIVLEQPAMAIDLLDDISELPMSTEVLLAKAYQMKGDFAKSISLLQSSIYQNIIGIFSACPGLMMLYAGMPDKMEECTRKVLELGDVFEIEEIHPTLTLAVYITAAQVYVMQGNQEKSLAMLEAYAKLLCAPDVFPVKLKGNRFFDSIGPLFDSLDMGTQPTVNDNVIKQGMKDAILKNPAFESLNEEHRFLAIKYKLEKI